MHLQKKKILITGGLGFVGSRLSRYLVQNNTITVLDNLFIGKKRNKVNGVKYIYDETKNINSIKELKKEKFDYIFHLGEYSRVEQSFQDIEKVIEFNTKPFYEIIKFAKTKKSKFIYSGSSTRFASYTDKDSISPYAWSKISNINFLKNYSNWFGLDYAITYFYNVYGEGEIENGKYATVIAKFLKQKKRGDKCLNITGPGTQKRNFTHVNDIICGLDLVAHKGYGDNFGIGSDKSYSIIELAKLLKMKYKIVGTKKGNRLNGNLKTSKTKKLGWKNIYNLEDYLKKH